MLGKISCWAVMVVTIGTFAIAGFSEDVTTSGLVGIKFMDRNYNTQGQVVQTPVMEYRLLIERRGLSGDWNRLSETSFPRVVAATNVVTLENTVADRLPTIGTYRLSVRTVYIHFDGRQVSLDPQSFRTIRYILPLPDAPLALLDMDWLDVYDPANETEFR